MASSDHFVSAVRKRNFEEDGYVVFDTGIPWKLLDRAIDDVQPYWAGKKSLGVPYADSGRVQDAWRISSACLKIAMWPTVLAMLRRIYGREPKPFQTLNFPVGTEQRTHSDAIHFNCEPFGLMCGVWLALEDIGAQQGPLVYYPGSHNLAETNFPELGIRADPENYHLYEDFIQRLIVERQLKPVYGIIKKGQAIAWAANLLHGGSARQDKLTSRHSQVTHYYFEGAKPWRPMYSRSHRVYFEPEWISSEAAVRNRIQFVKHRIRRQIKSFLGGD